jgi:predicted membrane metal-binding protein
VRLYESIVPPLGLILSLAGLPVISLIAMAQHWSFFASFNLIVWPWTAWTALVALGAAALHDVWCRPTGGGIFFGRARKTKRPEGAAKPPLLVVHDAPPRDD